MFDKCSNYILTLNKIHQAHMITNSHLLWFGLIGPGHTENIVLLPCFPNVGKSENIVFAIKLKQIFSEFVGKHQCFQAWARGETLKFSNFSAIMRMFPSFPRTVSQVLDRNTYLQTVKD
jgi:hypothetical protein